MQGMPPYIQGMQYPQPPHPQNFGTDLHSFMDGLNRIVQILYSSIPVFEFIKIVWKYIWKFCDHLGTAILSTFSTIESENFLQEIWEPSSFVKPLKKLAILICIGIGLIYMYFKRKQEQFFQDLWKDLPQESLDELSTEFRRTESEEELLIGENPQEEDFDWYSNQDLYY